MKEIPQVEASLEVLRRNSQDKEFYKIQVDSKEFIVLPDVFSPKYFESTPIFTRGIDFYGISSFLEIGTGTGITAVTAALHGVNRVVAVDINPNAVENTKTNAKLHGVSHLVDARLSDIFSAVAIRESFDAIYWNMPFMYMPDDYIYCSILERSLFDPGYRITNLFLRQAPAFLSSRGKLIIGFGNFGDENKLHKLAIDYGYKVKELMREKAHEINPIQFVLYELTKENE